MTGNDEKLGWAYRNLISSDFHFNYLLHEILFLNPRSQAWVHISPSASSSCCHPHPSPSLLWPPCLDELAYFVSSLLWTPRPMSPRHLGFSFLVSLPPGFSQPCPWLEGEECLWFSLKFAPEFRSCYSHNCTQPVMWDGWLVRQGDWCGGGTWARGESSLGLQQTLSVWGREFWGENLNRLIWSIRLIYRKSTRRGKFPLSNWRDEREAGNAPDCITEGETKMTYQVICWS